MVDQPLANVELPTGMSSEDAKKLWATFIKQRVTGKARDKAISQATKDLKSNYKDEFDELVAKYMPKK